MKMRWSTEWAGRKSYLGIFAEKAKYRFSCSQMNDGTGYLKHLGARSICVHNIKMNDTEIMIYMVRVCSSFHFEGLFHNWKISKIRRQLFADSLFKI